MKAISLDIETCIRQIMAARIDLALICHAGPNIRRARNELIRLLDTDAQMYLLGKESFGRILKAKKQFLKAD